MTNFRIKKYDCFTRKLERRRWQNKNIYIINKEEVMEGDADQAVETWTLYFQELLGGSTEGGKHSRLEKVGGVDVQLPSEEEVRGIIKGLKNNRSSGESTITAQMMKTGYTTTGIRNIG